MAAEKDTFMMQAERKQELRQLAHNIQTPLSVISMGLEAIKAVPPGSAEFNTMLGMMRDSGVEELKTAISQLVEAACRDDETR